MLEYICYGNHTGYGHAARGYIKSLHSVGVPINVTLLDRNWEESAVGDELPLLSSFLLEKSSIIQIIPDKRIIHTTPESLRRFTPNRKTVGYGTFEHPVAPPTWHKHLNKCGLVVYPSEFCENLFPEVTVPRVVIPHAYDASLYNLDTPPLEELGGFVFLAVGQWRDRKGLKELVQAYLKAFSYKDDVVLIIKTNSVNKASNYVEKLIHSESPNIVIDSEIYTDQEMARLYASADCVVLPSKGEGFGLPVLHALSVGCPVLCTLSGGLQTFAEHVEEIPICSTEFHTCIDNIPQFRKRRWPVIDTYILQQKLVEVKANHKILSKKAKISSNWCKNLFEYNVIGNNYKKALDIIS